MRRLGFEYHSHRPQARPADLASARADSRHGRSGLHRLPPLRVPARPRATEVVCMDNFITGSRDNIAGFCAPPRASRSSSTTSPSTSDVDGPLDWVLHFASPASPLDYLELPDPDAQGRRPRHPQRARPGQGQGRALPAGLDLRGLRRSAGASAARGLLGQREPGRAARRVRRGQALRRGHDHGLPPPPRHRHPHRAHLQHLRAPHAAQRRAGHPRLHDARPSPASPSRCSATARRRARSSTSPTSSTGIWRLMRAQRATTPSTSAIRTR